MQSLSALLFILTSFFVFQVDTFAMAQEVFWTETTTVHDNEKAHIKPVSYTVAGSATRIETSAEMIFIDYSAMTLYRLNLRTAQCTTVNLSVSEGRSQSSIVARKVRGLMAEIRVVATSEQRNIQGLSCYKKTALLGAGLFRLKTMAPITVESLGQSFHEARGEYWVSANVDAWQAVQKCCRSDNWPLDVFRYCNVLTHLALCRISMVLLFRDR